MTTSAIIMRAIITSLIITTHIATHVNYRMAVPGGSDFLAYLNFPEVYHAHEITTPPFYGGERAVAGQGRNTTYSVIIS